MHQQAILQHISYIFKIIIVFILCHFSHFNSFRPVSADQHHCWQGAMVLYYCSLQTLAIDIGYISNLSVCSFGQNLFYILSFSTELLQRCLEHFWFCLHPWKHHWHSRDRTSGKCYGQFECSCLFFIFWVNVITQCKSCLKLDYHCVTVINWPT